MLHVVGMVALFSSVQDVPGLVAGWVMSIAFADLLKGLVCFTVSATADACWAIYMRRSTTGHALHAAWFATLLMAMGMFNTKAWLGNNAFIPAILAGAFVGTYAAVRMDHRKGRTQKTADMPEAAPHGVIGTAA